MPGTAQRVVIGSAYVLGLNVGWVSSDAINQVVMVSDFVPLFITLIAAWATTLWFVTLGSWWERGVKELVRHAPVMAGLWFTSTFLNLMSLHYTSLSSNEALTTVMAPCSLLLSIAVLPTQRKCVILKVATVGMSVGGVLLIIFSDTSESGGDGPLGDVLAVISACAYACYDVYLKVKFNSDTDLRPYLAVMGTTVVIVGLPVLLLVSSVEPMVNFSPGNAALVITAAVLGNLVGDFCMAKAVVYLSPFTATVGAAINVPISFAIDHFLHDRSFAGQFVGGAVLCVAAFILTAVVELEIVQEKCSDERILCRDRSVSKESEITKTLATL